MRKGKIQSVGHSHGKQNWAKVSQSGHFQNGALDNKKLLIWASLFCRPVPHESLIKSISCKNPEPSGQHLPRPWRAVSPWEKLLCPDCFCHLHLIPWQPTERAECGSKSCQSHFTTTKSFSPSSFPLQTNRYCLPQALKSGGWIFPPALSSANSFSLSSSSTHPWKMGNNWNNKGEKALKWLDPKVSKARKKRKMRQWEKPWDSALPETQH